MSDPSGAAIPGAKVTITDQGSGLTRSVVSDKNGEYNFAQLNPGTYRLEVTKDRFKTSITEKVSVLVATPTEFHVKLELGAMSEQVVVESAAPELNTQDATVGNAIDEQDVKSLPFLARNVVNLLTLQPGVVFTGMSDTDRLSMGSVSTLDAREGSVNGMRGNQTNITVDGVDSNDWQNQAAFTSALPVTLDSVQEFRVTTTNANATNGLSGGAQVQLVTKNGSNEFHGNARWYYRTTGTSANTFFDNAVSPPVERGKDQRNIGGGSLGGPIKKDRLFFFLDNEERREAVAAGASRIVPSDSLRDGVLIYQCATATDCPTATTVQGLTASHTVPSGFHGLSPTDLKNLDPMGLGVNSAMVPYMNLFPHGNDPTQGDDAGTVDLSGNPVVANFIGLRFNAPVSTFNNVYIARIDYNITRDGKHTIFWRGSLQGLKTDLTEAQFPGQAPASQLLNNSRGFAVQYQGQLSPNLINTARYGLTRLGVAQSGVQGPSFSVRDFSSLVNFNARAVGRTVPVHEINDDVSWIKGKHTLQFGGVARFITNNRIDEGNSFPSFFSNNGFCVHLCQDVSTEINAAGSGFPASSNPTAVTRAFMELTGSITQVNATFFGNPSTGAISPAGTPDVRHFAERSTEGYVQDSWRVHPNLILTYGLRYGYETPVWETDGFEVRPSTDIMQWFQQRIQNMNAGIPSDASPLLSWTPAGKANKGANSWYDPYYKDFGPRLALAYSPGFQSGLFGSLFGGPGKSSLRLGAGITYDNIGQVIALDSDSSGSPGTSTALINNSQEFCLGSVGCPAPSVPAPRFSGTCTATGCTGLPAAGPPFFTPPTAANFPFTPAPTVSLTGFAVDPHLRTPYAIHLTVSFQRQLPKNVVLDVTYVGTLGRRLLGKIDYAQYLDIRDPQSKVDLWSAYRQIAQIAGITPQGAGPSIPVGGCLDPNVVTQANCFAQLKTIQPIPFFSNMLPHMPAFSAAFVCDPKQPDYATCVSGFNSLSPTQAFYAYVMNDLGGGVSWGCALFPMDTFVSPGGLPSPWNSKVDPQGDGLVLFQQQFQTLPGWSNDANSNYHSLQVSVRKTVGIATFGGNYVFSKSLDNSSSGENADIASGGGTLSGIIQNPFNLRDGRALSDFDLKHNFNGYWVVDLPFGKGRKFLGTANRLVDAAIGGWEVTGAARWHSGFPFGPGNGFNFPTNFFLTSSGTWTGSVQTSLTRNGAFGVPNIFKDANAAFNNVAFTLPGLAGSRNIMRGPAYASTDMGVYKTFKMTERLRLQFRVSAYNIFNSVNFADSSLSIDPTSPGTFGNLTSTAGPTTGSLGARDMEFAVRLEF